MKGYITRSCVVERAKNLNVLKCLFLEEAVVCDLKMRGSWKFSLVKVICRRLKLRNTLGNSGARLNLDFRCPYLGLSGIRGGRGFPNGSWGKHSTCNAGDTQGGILSQVQEDPLEKEMATHSSIPAWEIPWTEEPGGL